MSASRAEDLGQLLIIGLEEDRWSSALEKRIHAIRPGGILLTQRNLRTPETTVELLARVARALDAPPFLAFEEEGGAVDPLRVFLPPLPSPHIAAVKGLQRVERLGSLIGEALALLGFNLNFAPHLNLANPFVKPSLDPQCFSTDPRVVAQCGEAFVAGLRQHNVVACGKHFPGLSAAESADGSALPVVGKPMAALWREDLMPFRQLLPRLAMVKLSYAAYKAYDLVLPIPASCSANVLNGLLRVKLGYRGVAIADHSAPILETARGISGVPSEEVGMLLVPMKTYATSLMAGCDMQMIQWGRKSLELAAQALGHALDVGDLTSQRVDEALKRIARAKKGTRLPTGRISKKAFDRLCRQFEEFGKECRSAEREIV
jgi:beta-glucosidase-like glycosyl hydrolase